MEWGNISQNLSSNFRSLGMYGFGDRKIVKNPINEEYFAGGSSAGSAAAVRAD